MKRFDYPSLRRATSNSLLKAEYDHKRLVLIHSGAHLLLTVLIAAIVFLLDRRIDGTGGLGGLGQRSVLTTTKTILQLVQLFVLLFWAMGYLSTTLEFSRDEDPDPDSLLAGFRTWGPIIRLTAAMSILFGGLLFIAIEAGTFVFMLTPWAAPLVQVSAEYFATVEALDLQALEALLTPVLEQLQFPISCTCGLVFLALAVPAFYRFRLAPMCLMDHPGKGAFASLAQSAKLMRGNYGAMIRLDLHFWWYHGLYLLIFLVGNYGADAAEYFSLPVPADTAQLILTLVCAVCMLALFWWRKNEVSVAYAHAFDILHAPPKETPRPAPKNQPWNY